MTKPNEVNVNIKRIKTNTPMYFHENMLEFVPKGEAKLKLFEPGTYEINAKYGLRISKYKKYIETLD